MTAYSDFFLQGPARLKQYECLEISHPDFTKVYYLVRNKVGGLVATIDLGSKTFDYVPMKLTTKSDQGDMDFSLQVTFGDLGEIVPKEMDAIAAAGSWLTKPIVRYWAFRSDDLTTPMLGPFSMEVNEFPQTRQGTSFLASAPSLNTNRTGEMYLTSRFPMLEAFL